MSILPRHVDLELYAEDTALEATSCSPSLLVNYMEVYRCRLEYWLWD